MNPELRSLVSRAPWALQPEVLAALTSQLAAGEEIAARVGKPAQASAGAGWQVAVHPLEGLLLHKLDWWGTAVEAWRDQLVALAADPSINGIVVTVDSPGGSVYGIEEAADALYSLRGVKPVVALVNPLAASAAYWIASQAAHIVITPSGDAGSIGVWMAHMDLSRFYDEAGITVSLISAGRYKTEGNPWEPLGDEARVALQEDVDRSYAAFLRAVARGRGVDVATVEARYGQGRVLDAAEALAAGMVDQVGQLADAVEQTLLLGGVPQARIRGFLITEQAADAGDQQQPPAEQSADETTTHNASGLPAGVTEPSLIREWLTTQELLRRRRDG